MSRRSGDIKVNAVITVSVSPGSKLVAVLGVEGQSVDVVGRSSSRNSDNVVSFQIDCFLLDLVFENGMNSTMQQ